MIVTPIKTHKITLKDNDLFKVLDRYVKRLKDKSIVVITSKIVSITQGRVVKINGLSKEELVKAESELYLPQDLNSYKISLSIRNGLLVPHAGIDESNGNSYYILWPEDAQKTANDIREHFATKYKGRKIGVLITDSKTTPLRWGVTGVALGYSGFQPLKDYIGTKDLFGRAFQYEKLNIADSLASASVAVMGEGAERTPLGIITDIPFVKFVAKNPTEEELVSLRIDISEDIYAPLLTKAPWRKGMRSRD